MRSGWLPVLVVLGAAPAAAQQAGWTAREGVRQNCRGDYQAFCAQEAPGAAALGCLQQNASRLSALCRAAVVGNGPGILPLPAPRETALLREACAAESRSFCRRQRGSVECLMENHEALSESCQDALMAMRLTR